MRARSRLEHDPEKWTPIFGQDHASDKRHDPEKWLPVFGQDHASDKQHDPEKWTPVFGQDHAHIKKIEQDDGPEKSHLANIAMN